MIKKVALFTVLLVTLGFGTAFSAQIDSLASSAGPAAPTQVFVNPGGLGDVLIYGYYNVRGQDNFFTVTNTDTVNGARVRIRFREADTLVGIGLCNGSVEVLDFDICLSKGDVWSGLITSSLSTGDNPVFAKLMSFDTDTFVQASPPPTPGVIFTDEFPNGVPFKFGPGNNGITADQTREGYFEVIAERQLRAAVGTEIGTCGPDLVDVVGSDVGNVLMGHSYNVNVPTTAQFAYAATALGNFALADITSDITTNQPNLRDDSETGTIVPVNYALTKNVLYTVYDLESNILGKTNLIVNFPTKSLTHSADFVQATGTCAPGINDIFDDPRVKIVIFDDQEHSPTSVCQFSPCEPGVDVELPNEVNVIDINNSLLFVSDVTVPIATIFDFGWIGVNLVDTNTTAPRVAHQTTFGANTSLGLPVIGYVTHGFNAGTITGLIPLQYSTNIQPALGL